jgi:SSS family solute:Na+ symporter
LNLATIDIVIFVAYVLALIAIAYWVSREKPGHQKTTNDYFLAGNSLPWWAIGASLIAANISAEQIIGMSGSGFAIGLGIASYEWMAAILRMRTRLSLPPVNWSTLASKSPSSP